MILEYRLIQTFLKQNHFYDGWMDGLNLIYFVNRIKIINNILFDAIIYPYSM